MRNNALGSFSFDVIERMLDILNQHGRSMKKTSLASKAALNYNVCLRYILILCSIGWVEVNSEVSITETGKEAFAQLLDLSDRVIGTGDDIWPKVLGGKTIIGFGTSYILSLIQMKPLPPSPLPLPSVVTKKQIVSQSKHNTSIKKKTIMIVDDDKDVAQTYEFFLSSAGYEARMFNDARLALCEYVSNPFFYNLLVLDIRMQDINGIQLYQSIKAINPDLRAIFVSCLDVPRETVNLLPGMRPQDIIHKPVNKEQFIIAVKRALMR